MWEQICFRFFTQPVIASFFDCRDEILKLEDFLVHEGIEIGLWHKKFFKPWDLNLEEVEIWVFLEGEALVLGVIVVYVHGPIMIG